MTTAQEKLESLKHRSAPDEPLQNPLPTDVVETEPAKKEKREHHPKKASDNPPPPPPEAESFDVGPLLSDLQSIHLESLTYDDCGLLLNALSSATTAIGTTRRQRQEQLAAGTPQAKCETCKKTIDISKSGGFQILTVRDEHFQPKNVYFCSQNCLLGRGMPSHRTKKLPGDVGGPS
jgi:hypothetical protein